MKKTLRHSVKFASLLLLVCLVAFMPSAGTGGTNNKMSAKQMQDSINYYRNNTMINWDLIKKRIH